jgi:Phage tail tube protein, GTA-gp10
MTNRRRGEAAVELGGRRYRLCLTLGGLAELEEAFGAEDVSALSARFATGALSSRDLLKLLAVGLRGGGQALSDAEVAALPLEGGIEPLAGALADMLLAAFGEARENPP